MDNETYLGIFRMMFFDIIFPLFAGYISIEIIWHLFSNAVKGVAGD